MSSTPLLRLLHFLLLLLPAPLHDYYFPRLSSGGLDVYHPLILFAGFGCPDLEARLTEAYTPSVPRCGALKGKGWFPIYKFNTLDLVEHEYVPCFQEQMALVYDSVHNEYRNLAGVETRVLNFGSAYGFSEKQMIADRENLCLVSLRKELEAVGYRDGDTLFGAPYDMRYAPPAEGYVARVQELVEHASRKNGDKPVILVGHSFGATAVLGFLTSTPLPWRNKFIKHLLLISPPPPTGFTYDRMRFWVERCFELHRLRVNIANNGEDKYIGCCYHQILAKSGGGPRSRWAWKITFERSMKRPRMEDLG